jgi:hypothetical protein
LYAETCFCLERAEYALKRFALPGKILVAEQIRRIAIADGQPRAAATRTFNLNRRLYDAIAASKDQREAEARVRELLTSAKPKPTQAEFDQAIHFTELLQQDHPENL